MQPWRELQAVVREQDEFARLMVYVTHSWPEIVRLRAEVVRTEDGCAGCALASSSTRKPVPVQALQGERAPTHCPTTSPKWDSLWMLWSVGR